MTEESISLKNYARVYFDDDENSNHQILSPDRSKEALYLTRNHRFKEMFRNRPKAIVGIVLTISLLANICLLAILLQSNRNVVRFNDFDHDGPAGQQDASSADDVQPDIASIQASSKTAGSAGHAKGSPCPPQNVPSCQTDHPNLNKYTTPGDNIFEDLSVAEIQAVYAYLAQHPQFKVKPNNVSKAAHVYAIELLVPNKTQALNFIDGQGPKPAREAIVVVERTDLAVPEVQEWVVGPLPQPEYHRAFVRHKSNSIPHRFFPNYGMKEAFKYLFLEMRNNRELDRIIKESYGATFVNCKHRCLIMLPQRTNSAYSVTSIIVFTVYYIADFTTIRPVGLMFVMKETSERSLVFQVRSVHYAGQTYKSMRALITAYQHDTTPKTRMTYPKPISPETTVPGTMNLRGRKFPVLPQTGPSEFEPQGKRYKVTGQHVQYLEWSFSLRMSTASGPQLWDVRWAGERIAYEISLQEVGVIYAGANPNTYYTHLSDSAFGLGIKSQGLVRGVDCPEHATMLPQSVYNEATASTQTLQNAICVFEHNSGRPLRRHKSSDSGNGWNYGGLVDRVLIVRSIIVEYNYDYIFDTVFHQNGAVELKVYATGYIMSQLYSAQEDKFGFRVTDSIVGSIHHHIFNFKVDLDIKGRANRYETLDFTYDNTNWPWRQSSFEQIAFKRNVRKTEKQALYKYNFQTPKYHIVYNDKKRNKYGNHQAYRLDVKGFSYQLLPEDSPVLKSRRWSQYQLVTTKHKDNETSSSSVYSMFDGDKPVVDIDDYWKDDDSLLDEDLVFWVTVGMHHIPHTEDLPNTPTVGTETTISLMPYNYFTECPSLGARDAVRADLTKDKVVVQDYGTGHVGSCIPQPFDIRKVFENKSDVFV